MQRKPSCATTELTLSVSKDEWNTKEDTGKPLKNTLQVVRHECGMPKGTFQAEATLNSEKIKPVALAVIELCLTEGISQAVSQKKIPLNYFLLKIQWQLFGSISVGLLGHPYYEPLLWFMINRGYAFHII